MTRRGNLRAPGSLWLGAFVAIGCDGSLVTGADLDRPLLHGSGVITTSQDLNDSRPEPLAGETHLELGVLWVDPAQQGQPSVASSSDLLASAISADGKYTLDFRSPPPDAAIQWLDSSVGAGEPPATSAAEAVRNAFAFAFGELVLFDDLDGDGSFRVGSLTDGSPMLPPDEYRGMASSDVVLYVAHALPRGHNPLPELSDRITAVDGYHLGRVDCSDQTFATAIKPFVSPADGSDTPIQIVPASSTFPDLRACLRSHPASGTR